MLIKDAGQELAGTPHWVGVAALRDAQSKSSATTALAKQFRVRRLCHPCQRRLPAALEWCDHRAIRF